MAPVRLALLLAVVAAACQPDRAGERSTEVDRVRSGDIDVVLLSDRPALKQGPHNATIEFRRTSDGALVDVGTVRATATMPMAGMPPMVGSIDVRGGSTPGRYTAASDLTMAGEWQVSIEWDGPAGRGSASLSLLVQ
jgi:hypothetical protein